MPPAFRHWPRSALALAGLALCAALIHIACDSPDRSSDDTPAVVRSAEEAVAAALLEAGELPGDWQIVETPTPPSTGVQLAPPLAHRFDAAWRAWQACAYGRLSGGLIGLNRMAVAQSDVSNGPDDVSIATAAAAFGRDEVVQTEVDQLAAATQDCVPQGPGLSFEPGAISVQGDPAISGRVQITIVFANESQTQAFDLIAFREGRMISAAFLRDADDDTVNEVAELLQSQLSAAAASLEDET